MRISRRQSILAASSALLANPRSLVEQWLADVDANGVNQALIDRWMTPGFRMHFAGVSKPFDIPAYIAMAGPFYKSFTGARHRIEHILVDGDRVAVWTTLTAKHTGPFDGIAPTGREISATESLILRLSGGKITEEWVLFDSASLRSQLSA